MSLYHPGEYPDGWSGVILADHGLVAAFCKTEEAIFYLKMKLQQA
jgi:hypothetical protein